MYGLHNSKESNFIEQKIKAAKKPAKKTIKIDEPKNVTKAKTSKIDKENEPKMQKYKTLEDAISYEAPLLKLNCSQVFTHGPRNSKKNGIDYNSLRDLANKLNIVLYVHGSYLTPKFWEHDSSYMNHIIDTLQSCVDLDADGMVIHLDEAGNNVISSQMEKLSTEIKKKEWKNVPYLLLEMPARKPSDLTFETPEKINELSDCIKGVDIKWGWCFDTAHLWSGGINLSGDDSWNEWLAGLNEKSLNHIQMIHLNGALSEYFGKGRDKHIIPLSPEDGIWHHLIPDYFNKYLSDNQHLNEIDLAKTKLLDHINDIDLKKIVNSSFASIISFANKKNIPMIFEINRGKYIYAKLCFELVEFILLS